MSCAVFDIKRRTVCTTKGATHLSYFLSGVGTYRDAQSLNPAKRSL